MNATLPTGRYSTSAIWDGTNAYIFGGGAEIFRYNPSTDTLTQMSARLPTSRAATSAVWDGTHAYIFGGLDGRYLDQILRYEPLTDTLTVMAATLPTGRTGTSAIWDGTNAYIFGGGSATGYLNTIVRYNPTNDMATTMSATLPTGRYEFSATWDGTHAYLFGGNGGNGNIMTEIIRYDTMSDTRTVMTATLPTARSSTSAVSDGASSYIFGGFGGSSVLRQIVRYSLYNLPSAPLNINVSVGPRTNELSWGPPADDGGAPITAYNIYRGNASGSETKLATVHGGRSYTDDSCRLGFECSYRVSAVNDVGEGPLSEATQSVGTSATSTDGDDDSIPDVVEARLLCGRALTQDLIDLLSVGACRTTTDFETLPLDEDADRIPDAVEPTLCLVQDRGLSVDGRCVRSNESGADGTGTNYVPPQA